MALHSRNRLYIGSGIRHHSPIKQAPHSTAASRNRRAVTICVPAHLTGKSFALPVTRYVGARSLDSLQEYVVVGIGTCSHLLGRLDPKSVLTDSTQRMVDDRLAAVKLGPPNHFFVFGIDIAADAKLRCGPCKCDQKGSSGQTLRLQQRRNHNIRVEDDPDHCSEGRCPRRSFLAAAISASISSTES